MSIYGVVIASSVFALGYATPTAGADRNDAASPPAKQTSRRLPDSVRVTRAADFTTLGLGSDRQFVVECVLHFDPPAGDGKTRNRHKPSTIVREIPCPPIMVRDGERVTVADTARQEFTVAEISEAGVPTTIKRGATIGTTVEFTVLELPGNKVLLDAQAQLSGRNSRESMENDGIELIANLGRTIKQTELDEKVVARFEGWWMELTVRRGPIE